MSERELWAGGMKYDPIDPKEDLRIGPFSLSDDHIFLGIKNEENVVISSFTGQRASLDNGKELGHSEWNQPTVPSGFFNIKRSTIGRKEIVFNPMNLFQESESSVY